MDRHLFSLMLCCHRLFWFKIGKTRRGACRTCVVEKPRPIEYETAKGLCKTLMSALLQCACASQGSRLITTPYHARQCHTRHATCCSETSGATIHGGFVCPSRMLVWRYCWQVSRCSSASS